MKIQLNKTNKIAKMNRLIKYLDIILFKLKSLLGIDIQYKYKSVTIALPAGHMLPFYQKNFKNYDKFLPHLCSFIKSKATVVDVGANCGDTLASMYCENKELTYVCIEPDDIFFKYLVENVERIKRKNREAIVFTHKVLIGKSVSSAFLQGSGGTKHAVMNDDSDNSIISQSLDDLLVHDDLVDVELLKSDVDGFDYDIVDSAETLINCYFPMIYMECDFRSLAQKTSYKITIENLRLKGYMDWVVFDNFGEMVCRTNDIVIIDQLFEYTWRQRLSKASPTIYYFDVLAATAKHRELIDVAVREYNKTNN